MKYPPTPLGAEALRCAGAKASEGYPPVATSAVALTLRHMNDSTEAYAFIHGQSPCLHAEVPAFDEAALPRQALWHAGVVFCVGG